jgi:O-acetylhomoserine/O-acetylserine sulfhydrylase-like pyridoxal-dependent enzyme
MYATKYLSGHEDALGGVVLGPQAGCQRIRKEMLVHLDGAMSPFNAWLILRGLMTLPPRMERHCQNAMQVVHSLEAHPRVSRAIYPRLESHPNHDLARRQMSGFGGMLTFQLKGGLGAAITLAEKVCLLKYATPLGHAHSPHFYYPTDVYVDAAPYLSAAQKAGIREWMGEGIVRVSVGLEKVEDLMADLDQALRGRTFKGLVGPLAYRLRKQRDAPAGSQSADSSDHHPNSGYAARSGRCAKAERGSSVCSAAWCPTCRRARPPARDHWRSPQGCAPSHA